MVSSRKSRSDTMMDVHHTGDPIKPEPVELILFNPEPQVTEQEPHHFVVSVVEEATVPKFMTSLSSLVEIEVIGAVKFVQPIEDILTGMRVNDIEEDRYSHSMGGVDELLEVLWQSVARAGSKKACHLVAKRYESDLMSPNDNFEGTRCAYMHSTRAP